MSKEIFAVVRIERGKLPMVVKSFTDYDVARAFLEKIKEDEPDAHLGIVEQEPS